MILVVDILQNPLSKFNRFYFLNDYSVLYVNYMSIKDIKKQSFYEKSNRGMCHSFCSCKMIHTGQQVQNSRIIQQQQHFNSHIYKNPQIHVAVKPGNSSYVILSRGKCLAKSTLGLLSAGLAHGEQCSKRFLLRL